MITEKTGGYISRLEFNTGESLDVKKNDIVVFVGPNNAGKSQSLKDIYTLSSRKLSTIVVSDIETVSYTHLDVYKRQVLDSPGQLLAERWKKHRVSCAWLDLSAEWVNYSE